MFSTLLESLPDGHRDWEDVIEYWGMVFNSEELISYVCEPIPLAFLDKRFSKYLNPIVNAFGVVHVDAEDISVEAYRIDRNILKEIFITLTDVVDYNSTCLKDIWHATVTMPVRKD
ncbi:hypothetical protein PY650_12605 [Rhizobium calliandrae]|uniref:Uncharacterized protein n=1 Tax=Rhizobium calliandrae TaxID=1312182 RepID=A0ABT7KCY6_9HYPH|nr:hypothetical protein [Rhizobium calliandrae]MDL2406486.1 hypothetical protein [Rhizobium calliandrae]